MTTPAVLERAATTSAVSVPRQTLRVSWATWAPLAVLVGALVAWNAYFSLQSWFFYDDFIYFRQAQSSGLSFSYLTRELNVHFSPGYRFVAWLFQSLVPLNFDVAQALLLAGFAASVVVLYLILTELFEPHPVIWLLVVLYGTSLVNIDVLQWWSSSLQSVPTVLLSLLCILAYLRFYRTGSRQMLALSVAALTLGLAFYVKVVLVPLYLVGMRVLLLERARPLRPALVATGREWKRVWAWYAVPLALYVVIYLLGYWAPSGLPSLSELASFLQTSWVRAFVPAMLGLHVSSGNVSGSVQAGVVVAQLLVIAVVAWSLARRRSAWRAWVFFGLCFLANVVLVGVPRVSQWGSGIGYLLRYYPEPAYLLPIAIGAAFWGVRREGRPAADHGQVGGHGQVGAHGPVGASVAGGGRWQTWRLRPALTSMVIVAAVGAHLALGQAGATQLAKTSPGRSSGPYMGNVMASLHRIEAGGVRPTILDGVVPDFVVAPWSVYGPPLYNHYAELFKLIDPNLSFDNLGKPIYEVTPNGLLHPGASVPGASGAVQDLVGIGVLAVNYGQATPSAGGGLCIQATPLFPAQVELSPPAPLTGPGPWYLGLRYTSTVPMTVPLFLDHGSGYPYPHDRYLQLEAGTNQSVLDNLGSPGPARLRLDLPPSSRTCLTQLVLGGPVGAAPPQAHDEGQSLSMGGVPDTFTGPDNQATLGPGPGGAGWQEVAGRWGTSGGQAYVSAPAPGRDLAVVGAAGSVQARLARMAPGAGLVFRYQDPANYWYVAAVPAYASWAVIKVVNGQEQVMGKTVLSPVQDDTTVTVASKGNTIDVAIDGVVRRSLSDPVLANATTVGLTVSSAGAPQARFADFRIGPPGAHALSATGP